MARFLPSERPRAAEFGFLRFLFIHTIVRQMIRIKSAPPATESPMIVVVFSWAASEPPVALLFWRLNRELAGVMVGGGAILGVREGFRGVDNDRNTVCRLPSRIFVIRSVV